MEEKTCVARVAFTVPEVMEALGVGEQRLEGGQSHAVES